jgi:ribonuclease G
VQVSKEPINAKGPKLTTCFSLPGRFVILMPNIPKIGISKKIIDFDERKRLKDIILSVCRKNQDALLEQLLRGRLIVRFLQIFIIFLAYGMILK